MSTITLREAQASLADLVHHLAPGEAVTIIEDDRPVARLVMIQAGDAPRPVPGRCRGMMTMLAEDYDHLKDWSDYMP